MKNVVQILFVFLLGCLAGYLIKPSKTITGATLTQGKTDTVYIAGKTDTIKIYKKIKGSSTEIPVNASPQTSLFEKKIFIEAKNETKADVNITINTYPACDSITLDWFANIEAKQLERVDTIKITKIDTLQVFIEKPQAFYDTFEFGFGTAVAAVLTIFLLTK
ncbi:MAG: hypothetical protein NZM09_12100 [Ignavibacterium sp.]|nr:hypothetical protein [Ignavibacterium sp.]MDW8376417.1 hypothetical protein [Ignavibacteriales bacterium]